MSQHLGVTSSLLHVLCSNPKHKAQVNFSCMPKESQPRKNAYDTYFPLLFAFKFKVKFDGVKKKVASFVLGRNKKNKKERKKKLPAPSVFVKVAWESTTLLFLALWDGLQHIYSIIDHVSCNMTKPTKWLCVQRRLRSAWGSAQSDQSLHCPHEETYLSYLLSAQRRLWSDWVDAQADLSLCWAHSHFVGFVMRRLMGFSWISDRRNCTSCTSI